MTKKDKKNDAESGVSPQSCDQTQSRRETIMAEFGSKGKFLNCLFLSIGWKC